MSKPNGSSKKPKPTNQTERNTKEKYNKDLKPRNEKNNSKLAYNATPTVVQFSSSSHENVNNQLRNKKNLRNSDKKRQRQPTFGIIDEPKKKTYFPQFGCEEHTSRFDYLRNNLCIKTGIANQEPLKFQMKKITLRNYTPKILNQEANIGMWI